MTKIVQIELTRNNMELIALDSDGRLWGLDMKGWTLLSNGPKFPENDSAQTKQSTAHLPYISTPGGKLYKLRGIAVPAEGELYITQDGGYAIRGDGTHKEVRMLVEEVGE